MYKVEGFIGLILAVVLATAGVLQAADNIWVGLSVSNDPANLGYGDWFDPANWSLGVVPTDVDQVIFDQRAGDSLGSIARIDGAAVATGLWLGHNATSFGWLEITANGSLTLSQGFEIGRNNADSDGVLTCAGIITAKELKWPRKGRADILLTGDAQVTAMNGRSELGQYDGSEVILVLEGNAQLTVNELRLQKAEVCEVTCGGDSVLTVDGSKGELTPGNGTATYWDRAGTVTFKDNATFNFNARMNANKNNRNTYNFQDNCTANIIGSHFDFKNDVINIIGGTLNIDNKYNFRLYDETEVYQDGGLVTTTTGKALAIEKGTYILDANGVLALNEITGNGNFYMDGGVYAVNMYTPPFTHYGGALAPGFDQISQMQFTEFSVIDPNSEWWGDPRLLIQLGGVESGDYDSVAVTGPVKLGGDLLVCYTDSFEPNIVLGDTFEIILAESIISDFNNVVDGLLTVKYHQEDVNNLFCVGPDAEDPNYLRFTRYDTSGIKNVLYPANDPNIVTHEYLVTILENKVLLTRGSNLKPDVDAGDDLVLFQATSNQGTLTGSYTDDVRPAGATYTHQWSVLSQPADSQIDLSAPTSLVTDVTVDTLGSYILELAVSDSNLVGTNTVTVIYTDAGAISGPVIAHYTFDQTDRYTDKSGNGLDLIAGGDARISDDAAVGDGALRVSGTGYASRALVSGQSLPITDAVSVSYWYKEDPVNPADNWCGVIGDGLDAPGAHSFIVLRPSATRFKWQVQAIEPYMLQYDVPADGPDIYDGQWHHVVCTLQQSGADANYSIYVDGELRDTTPVTAGTIQAPAAPAIHIADAQGGGNMFKGWLDEVKILNIAMDTAQVAEEYAKGNSN